MSAKRASDEAIGAAYAVHTARWRLAIGGI
jgi:hypothetical protein